MAAQISIGAQNLTLQLFAEGGGVVVGSKDCDDSCKPLQGYEPNKSSNAKMVAYFKD